MDAAHVASAVGEFIVQPGRMIPVRLLDQKRSYFCARLIGAALFAGAGALIVDTPWDWLDLFVPVLFFIAGVLFIDEVILRVKNAIRHAAEPQGRPAEQRGSQRVSS